jgi:hypothetical protein
MSGGFGSGSWRKDWLMRVAPPAVNTEFARSRVGFDALVDFLGDQASAELTHSELEDHLQVKGRDLLRQLLQDHVDLRAAREERLSEVAEADGTIHTRLEHGHTRGVATIFGDIDVARLAYRARFSSNLYPADAVLNLPAEKYSFGLRRLAAIEAGRGSFEQTVAAIERATGQRLGKRQIQELILRAALDVEDFYRTRDTPMDTSGDVLALTYDGKGVVMRADALRAATAKAATSQKLSTRLSKGEKRNRKRMAEVGAVYDVVPSPRTPSDIITNPGADPDAPAPQARARRPVTRGKWLTASVTNGTGHVISAVFDEAERRDPNHHRTWIALVDGNNHQIDQTTAQARARGVEVTIVIDFVHVLEYVWKAAWCFHHEGDPDAERWVAAKALEILSGNAGLVAAAIRRTATRRGLSPEQRRNADTTATYLHNKKKYLDYPTALAAGWPIATGVIEGACRHLVKDRMDITGARWGLDGAEAVLTLRALTSNDDFNDYWTYHQQQEQLRVHNGRYWNDTIPT